MPDDAKDGRDIDLVLVTGAGASREFGVNGTSIPLMSEWSDALVDKISGRSWSYLEATRLEKGLDGPTFERRLGQFLQLATALPQIEQVLKPSLEFQPPPNGVSEQALRQWQRATLHHIEEIVHLVRESLYECFSPDHMDLDAAAQAYSTLLQQLGITKAESMVYATTNYDIVGEYAIERIGGFPDCGEQRGIANRPEAKLRIDGLLGGMPRYVPVLHLHGRIGWYQRSDSESYSSDIRTHNRDSGVPILMLPDPNKVYDTNPNIVSLWTQFEDALRRAKRVLVLGHSLHDDPLVEALQRNVSPGERVAITTISGTEVKGTVVPQDEDLRNRVVGSLPAASVIPINFAQGTVNIADHVEEWNRRIEASLQLF